MKNNLTSLLTFLLIVAVFTGCGPSEEEKQQQEQARQDSLEQVRQQRMEQQRQDSLAKARIDSPQKQQPKSPTVSFTDNGRFAVQVESWRSQQKARSRAKVWKERGFDDATVIKYGNEATGNVWFRVRLGQLQSRDDAKQLQQNLQEEYQTDSWITTI